MEKDETTSEFRRKDPKGLNLHVDLETQGGESTQLVYQYLNLLVQILATCVGALSNKQPGLSQCPCNA